MEEPDSTTPAEHEFAVDDDVLCTLNAEDQLYLGSVVQVNRLLKKCLVRFMDDTETWCDFNNMKVLETVAPDVMCVVCKSSQPLGGNQLVTCACGRGYHQRCHQPAVLGRDPNWRCRICSPKRGERIKPVVAVDPTKTQIKPSAQKEECLQCRGKDYWTTHMVQCRRCSQWVHGSCMYEKRFIMSGDRFYVFICGSCNRGKELCCRLAMKRTDLVHLVLYNLNVKHHYKFHDLDSAIMPLVLRHWTHLMLPSEINSIAVTERRQFVLLTLQSNSKLFRSGREVKKRHNLWGLRLSRSPRPPRVTLPARGQVDVSHVQARIVPPPERPLQNGHVNSSRKGEESDSGRSSSPPDPVDSSSEYHGLGLVKRSVPFPPGPTDSSTAADARFRSQAVRRAARLLRRRNVPIKLPVPSRPPMSLLSISPKPRLSDSEEEALRSLVPNTIQTYLSPIEPKTEVRKRPQRNLLEARLNSTESKLYKPIKETTPTESPTKKKMKKDAKEGKASYKIVPKRLVQKTLLDTFKLRDAAEDSASSSDEKIPPVIITRQLSVKDIIIRDGVVKRRRRLPRKIIVLPPRKPPASPPPTTSSSSASSVLPYRMLGPNWRRTWQNIKIDLNQVRELLSPLARAERGEPMIISAKRTLPNGEVYIQLEPPSKDS